MSIYNAAQPLSQSFSAPEEYPLVICKSNAGYYIGRLDKEGFPYSRESKEYFQSKELATVAFETDTWTRRTGW